jgi:hypothetical protein
MAGKPLYKHKLPLENFEQAHKVFLQDHQNNKMIMEQYEKRKKKNDKIKFLRFMGYLI